MVKITQLEVENLKRIKSCTLEPSANGLTVIGGKNGQGKTSTLDAIAWALGGDKHRPSNPTRDGSVIPPSIRVTLSNGLVVERKGKNGSLKVTDPNGSRSGQQLLNDFVEQLAINLPKFINSSNKEKASILLSIIGVQDQLAALDYKEQSLYNQRRIVGQEADRKRKHADELPFYEDLPDAPVSASELIRQQQEILARNGENQRKRIKVDQLQSNYDRQHALVSHLEQQLSHLKQQLTDAVDKLDEIDADLQIARISAQNLKDESTAELEANIESIEALNVKIRSNLDRAKADDEARALADEYARLTTEIETVRNSRLELLDHADLPLPGLSVQDGELTYKGAKWDCMSSSDQLRVATAIVRAINPRCGFVLMDKLEQMDLDTMRDFGAWLEQEGLQVIATRVSTGDDCSIIIEDGYSYDAKDYSAKNNEPKLLWTQGVF